MLKTITKGSRLVVDAIATKKRMYVSFEFAQLVQNILPGSQ